MADYITKARYWMAILYPENMIYGWQENISTLLQVPFCYVIHDKDLTTDGSTRKIHVHVLIALGNTTTYSSALSIFKNLQAPDKPSCIPNDEIRQVRNIRNVYDYFIHDTEDSIKLGKHLYSKSDRICGNSFDIGCYEQLGQAEKDKILRHITDICFNSCITNFAQLLRVIINEYDEQYFQVVKSNTGYFQALTRGIFHEMSYQGTTTEKNVTCDECKEQVIELS